MGSSRRPNVFSGYDTHALPQTYADFPHCGKPIVVTRNGSDAELIRPDPRCPSTPRADFTRNARVSMHSGHSFRVRIAGSSGGFRPFH